MVDQVTRVTSESWLQRLGRSIMGVLLGIVLVLGGMALLFWNEGRAVKEHKKLEEGAGLVVSVDAEQALPGNEGKLIHFSAEAVTDEQLRDPRFGIAATALKLRRTVEMYQWTEHEKKETKKKTGGKTETRTTYTYDKQWVSRQVDSSHFEERSGHENPAMPFHGDEWVASTIMAGAFSLSDTFKDRLDRDQPLQVAAEHLAALPADLQPMKLQGGAFYRGTDPAAPAVGDLRISFSVVQPAMVSLVGKQVGTTLTPYTTKNGDLALFSYGTKAAAEMFAAAESANKMLTWILRGVGIVVLFLGFASIFKPLSVFADVIPFLGNLVEAGTGMISFGLALALGLLVIAIGWIIYRPLLGIALLVAVVAVVVLVVRAIRSKSGARTAGAAVPPPPPPPPA